MEPISIPKGCEDVVAVARRSPMIIIDGDTVIGHAEKKVDDANIIAVLTETAWAQIRRERAALFLVSDSVALRCFKAGIEYPAEWFRYDQALRKIPSGDDLAKIEWPTTPQMPDGI